MVNSNITVEIIGEYVIIKKDDNKSVLDSEDILNLLTEFTENENKMNQLAKECNELKIMMGAKWWKRKPLQDYIKKLRKNQYGQASV